MKAKKNVVMVVVFRSSVIHIYIYHVLQFTVVQQRAGTKRIKLTM